MGVAAWGLTYRINSYRPRRSLARSTIITTVSSRDSGALLFDSASSSLMKCVKGASRETKAEFEVVGENNAAEGIILKSRNLTASGKWLGRI